jgi:hypothetical protein
MTGKEFIDSKLSLPHAYIMDDKLYTRDKVYSLGDLFDEYAKLRLSAAISTVCDHEWIKSATSKHMMYCGNCGGYKPEGT